MINRACTDIIGRVIVLAVVFSGLFAASPAIGQALGRVFYTPAQRAQLDQNERSGHNESSPVGSNGPDNRQTTLNYNGAVRRSNGPSTAWVNGRPLDANTRHFDDIDLHLRGSALVVTEKGKRTVIEAGEQHVLGRQGQQAPTGRRDQTEVTR